MAEEQPQQAQPPSAPMVNENERVYTDEDLECFGRLSGDAGYFEKAQDFKPIIKILRYKYLNLRSVLRTLPDGSIETVYQKDLTKPYTGINEEGVENNIRFLEARLGQHTVLSSWSEERMFTIMRDDMYAWRDMMIQNFEKYEMSESAMIELRVLMNDLLESAYRRPIDNMERQDMRPIGTEIRRMLGLDKEREIQQQGKYPTGMVDKMREEMNY